ncbi:hypothetical protein RRG08_030394 [Elysia crispata]|uniref:Uncharacterized protein n=1 Tax=Elysia crispata TaxID=231223 RepID=A0AAE0YGL1_9GAST|nr:hypothetical protein RRG08_030394 [Elysia crispata]
MNEEDRRCGNSFLQNTNRSNGKGGMDVANWRGVIVIITKIGERLITGAGVHLRGRSEKAHNLSVADMGRISHRNVRGLPSTRDCSGDDKLEARLKYKNGGENGSLLSRWRGVLLRYVE